MLLRNLNVHRHRFIENLALDDLARFSIIVGANNSGKSSILEAVALLLRPFDPSQWVQVAQNRDMDADVIDALWAIFPKNGLLQLDDAPLATKSALQIEGETDCKPRTLKAKAVIRNFSAGDRDDDIELRVIGEVEKSPLDFQFRRHRSGRPGIFWHPPQPSRVGEFPADSATRCYTITPVSHRSGKILVEYLSRVVDEGEKDLAFDMLRLFDPNVVSLDVSAGRRQETVVVKHKRLGIVHLASFGDGMRRATMLALALTRARNGMLLIDELEAGIHPKALATVFEKLLEAARKTDVQIIATTHSLEALDALVAVAQTANQHDELAGYHLSRHADSHRVRRYDGKQLQELRNAGVDLR